MQNITNGNTGKIIRLGGKMEKYASKQEVNDFYVPSPEWKVAFTHFTLTPEQSGELLQDVGYAAAFLYEHYCKLASYNCPGSMFKDESVAKSLGLATTTVRDHRLKLEAAKWIKFVKDTKARKVRNDRYFTKAAVNEYEGGELKQAEREEEAARERFDFQKEFTAAIDFLGLTTRSEVLARFDEVVGLLEDGLITNALTITGNTEKGRLELINTHWLKLRGTNNQRQNFKQWKAKNPDAPYTLADYVEHGAVKLNRMLKEAAVQEQAVAPEPPAEAVEEETKANAQVEATAPQEDAQEAVMSVAKAKAELDACFAGFRAEKAECEARYEATGGRVQPSIFN